MLCSSSWGDCSTTSTASFGSRKHYLISPLRRLYYITPVCYTSHNSKHRVFGPSSCGLDDVSRVCSVRPQCPGCLPVSTNIRHMSRRLRACVPASTTTMTNAGSAILARRSFMLVEGWRSARTADIRSTPPSHQGSADRCSSQRHTHPHASDFDEFPFSTDWERIR